MLSGYEVDQSVLQSSTSSYFGQETIQHSVRFARLRRLEPRKDGGDVIYVVRDVRKGGAEAIE